jgi:hypothetical protein
VRREVPQQALKQEGHARPLAEPRDGLVTWGAVIVGVNAIPEAPEVAVPVLYFVKAITGPILARFAVEHRQLDEAEGAASIALRVHHPQLHYQGGCAANLLALHIQLRGIVIPCCTRASWSFSILLWVNTACAPAARLGRQVPH